MVQLFFFCVGRVMEVLPDEILLSIFTHLSPFDILLRIQLVNIRWFSICKGMYFIKRKSLM